MHAPIYSTVTLFAEILISAAIYYTLYAGYKKNIFSTKLAGVALLYEIVFNITYMVSQAPKHAKVAHLESAFLIGLAVVHGVLSLIMFVTLIIFFLLAWRAYKQGINYFLAHKVVTGLFLVFWTFSVVSGILFYLVEYVF